MGDVIWGLQGQAQHWTQQGAPRLAVLAGAEGTLMCLLDKMSKHQSKILDCSHPTLLVLL